MSALAFRQGRGQDVPCNAWAVHLASDARSLETGSASPHTSVLMPWNLSSPGLKGFSSCFTSGLSLPSASTFTTKGRPGVSSDSMALSRFTLTVSPGGLKDACIQDSSD